MIWRERINLKLDFNRFFLRAQTSILKNHVHTKMPGKFNLKIFLASAIRKNYIFVQSPENPEKSSPDLESATIPGFFIFPALLYTASELFSYPCEALIYFNFHNFHFFLDFTNRPPQAICSTNRKHFRDAFLQQALVGNFVEMTIPEKPSSPLQKYRLTETGSMALKKSRGGE